MKGIRQTVMAALAALIVFAVAACAPAADATPVEEGAAGDYSVDLGPEDFVEGVDNPYFPLAPGTRYVYEARLDDGGTERIEIEILAETRDVMGVAATVFHDQVFVDDQLVEDTHDWFAQDTKGNVWYLGEAVDNYQDGELVNHEGAWEWGVDGALPGVIMWADPAAHLDEAYYQEYYPGQAEDMGQVVSLDESVTVPAGSYEDVLQTYEFSPLEAGGEAHKFYAPGIGTIKEVELGSGEEVVLIEYVPPGG
jgi:hypothetical protein